MSTIHTFSDRCNPGVNIFATSNKSEKSPCELAPSRESSYYRTIAKGETPSQKVVIMFSKILVGAFLVSSILAGPVAPVAADARLVGSVSVSVASASVSFGNIP